jgi:inner membrane protein
MWQIHHISRDLPQQWIGSGPDLDKSVFGVNLLVAVDEYQKTMRTVKYAIMFIALTFLTFFMVEVLSKKVIHPFQYTLIGFALVVFYTLLLALSEHMLFNLAYLISSASVVILITLYARSVLVSMAQSLMVGAILAVLYGYLYIILQLQDYALLMGSVVLFVALAVTMFLTRKVDWFTVMQGGNDSGE